jgi:hypothetical protein
MAAVIKLSAKIAVAAGAVYATLDQGVWSGTSARGTQALSDISSQIFPATNDYLNKVPTSRCINAAAVNSWNSGIKKTFSVVASAPETACKYSHKAIDRIKESIGS